MRLRGKSAVIYGGNSPAGASLARAIAKEGATVYLAGRSTARLEPVARSILDAGGVAEVSKVDPMSLTSVSEHLHQIVVNHGTVDISLNMAFLGTAGAGRLCNLSEEQFTAAAFTRVRSNFVTAAAAAREMAHQGRGIILATAVPRAANPEGADAGPIIGSGAIEALCNQLREDVGSYGVKVAYLRDVPDSEEELTESVLEMLSNATTTSSPVGAPRREAVGTIGALGAEASA